jgi:hypothetical protein
MFLFTTFINIKIYYISFELGLPPVTIRIKDALEKCPIKVEHFTKTPADRENEKTGVFKDKFLNSLDEYLEELRSKQKHEFVTEGCEARTDIQELGMSKNQLKKLKKVRDFFFQFFTHP